MTEQLEQGSIHDSMYYEVGSIAKACCYGVLALD